jgi:hypothetical protein
MLIQGRIKIASEMSYNSEAVFAEEPSEHVLAPGSRYVAGLFSEAQQYRFGGRNPSIMRSHAQSDHHSRDPGMIPARLGRRAEK